MWTRACDRRLALISYTMITDNVVVWETRLSTVDWVYSKTQISLETLKILNELRRELYDQTSVSHSSTESEVISSDAGLRLQGIHLLLI